MAYDLDIEIARAQLACQSSGRAGLNALLPQPKLDAAFTTSQQRAIENWLQRELSAYAQDIKAANCRYTIKCSQGPQMQLRFSARYSRWLLLVRRERYWWPHLPRRKRCLALVDWLGQVRQIVTGRCSPDDTVGPRQILDAKRPILPRQQAPRSQH